MARKNDNKYVYGICQNRDYKDTGKPCPKCSTREIQKLRADEDFVCAECKEELRKVPAPPPPRNWKLIIGIIASIAVIVCVIFCVVRCCPSKAPIVLTPEPGNPGPEEGPEEVGSPGGDTISPIPPTPPEDTGGTINTPLPGGPGVPPPGGIDSTKIGEKDSVKKEPDKPGPKDPDKNKKGGSTGHVKGTVNLGYATYTGDLLNGKPDGNGVLKFKQRHVVDSRDVKQRMAEPGETLSGVFEDGHLVSGTLKHKDGNPESIII